MKNTFNINKQKGEELVKRTPVENSPFQIITTNGKSFVVLGKYRITQEFDTEEECMKAINPITWERLIQVCILVADELSKQHKN